VIVIDSSGSVDEELLNTFLGEVNFLMSLISNYQIELLVCDDKVHSHKTFYSGESLDVSLKGGGGTSFKPAFTFVEENFDDVKLLLYFTDLDGKFPSEVPNYDVKWVSSQIKKIPFGSIIEL
jgi:predicted metal-dependent peptidase